MPEQPQTIFSVSEANNFIKALLDGVPQLREIFVRGEISNYKVYPSGHHYFSLKDAEGALRCVMFRGSASSLRFRPENGMKVIAFGRISVFPRDGSYQLYVSELTAEGAGDLHVAFEQLKAKLDAEGLFDPAHKKPLPRYPKTIAIVTSSAGAAVHDMIRILGARWPQSRIVLLPVRVQGAEAPPEIAGALRYANKWRVADVIITGRGGGSMEDLWAFNDERVARAIYDSVIPVISAVGHEPDVTIADYVADARASTPSNAAEIAVPDQNELRRALETLSGRMEQSERARLDALRNRLNELAAKRVLTDPTAFIADKRLLLDYTQKTLAALAEKQLAERQRRFAALCASLDALSPLKVLSRGYAMARGADGQVIRRAKDVAVGEKIDLTLGEGRLGCVVESRETGGGQANG
ncbi:MAG: exodeoxyribonuclease VII large subunit [Ruminococcaceae bacterium]|nr:exodeoxyribonuclease VII large subunit [Oscillospiraceae bacterium]